MSDMISREDVLRELEGWFYDPQADEITDTGLHGTIRALPAAQAKVKPLVWVMDEHGGFFAKGLNRTYSVFRLALDQETWGAIGVSDTSKDSRFVMDRCQADYVACILSALEPAVQPDAAAIREAALDRARPALAEALAALSWAKANLQSLAAQCRQEGATFPMVDRAIQSVSDAFYNPGKEVRSSASVNGQTDTAPAGLSAGGGAGHRSDCAVHNATEGGA